MFKYSSKYLEKARTIIPSLLFLLFVQILLAQDHSDANKAAIDTTRSSIPSVSDIVPLASELSAQYTHLDNEIKTLLDQNQVKEDFVTLKEKLIIPRNKLDSLIKEKKVRIDKLIELKKLVDKQNESFEDINNTLQIAIGTLNKGRKKWLNEKQKWDKWEEEILKEGDLEELKLTFSQAQTTIKKALDKIVPDLEEMLKIQKTGFEGKKIILGLETELESMIHDQRHNVFLDASPPMFSAKYAAQFSHQLWNSFRGGLRNVNWVRSSFFEEIWWIFLIQILLSIILLVFIYRKEKQILALDHYSFIAKRPIAVSIFFGLMCSFVFYQLEKIPSALVLAMTIVGGLSFARIASALIKDSWKLYFVNGIILLLVFIRIFNFINLPIPLYRIFIVVSSILGVFFSLRNVKFIEHKKKSFYYWALYGLAIISSVVIVSNIIGKEGLTVYLFETTLRFLSTVMVYILFLYLVHGGVTWLMKDFVKHSAEVSSDVIQRSINRTLFVVDFFIIVFVLLPMSLSILGIYSGMSEAIKEMMTIGFKIGNFKITTGLIITAISIIYAARFISTVSQRVFMSKLFDKRKVEKGARLSVNRLLNYFIMSIGFLLALSSFGFEITKVTIVLSALGIGIGFGLQGIVNNFVSGLILLFDRPIREGDQIQVGEVWSTVKKIGLRATWVETADEADLIVPNADLVYNQVTNWTLSNRYIRIKIDVGVAYGSDVTLVIETLLAAAKANQRLYQDHAPQVLFLGFGDSSLNFELRVWGLEASDRMVTHSELNQDIDKRFREANIEIAFPQQDLHVRSIDKSISLKSVTPIDKSENE